MEPPYQDTLNVHLSETTKRPACLHSEVVSYLDQKVGSWFPGMLSLLHPSLVRTASLIIPPLLPSRCIASATASATNFKHCSSDIPGWGHILLALIVDHKYNVFSVCLLYAVQCTLYIWGQEYLVSRLETWTFAFISISYWSLIIAI